MLNEKRKAGRSKPRHTESEACRVGEAKKPGAVVDVPAEGTAESLLQVGRRSKNKRLKVLLDWAEAREASTPAIVPDTINVIRAARVAQNPPRQLDHERGGRN